MWLDLPSPSPSPVNVMGGDRLARLLEKAKPQNYYLVPWPVKDYDAGG
ncbi:MAG TPA: hypothetical protein VE953_21380 [Terriglobales bacterium]|nr:hypothetical protein [Terriglobales bacterium]